jgi:DNA helicase-2/ATP-dependent DNA helicase PcrA
MHRLTLVGNDAGGSAALEDLALSMRPAKHGSNSWRHETARRDYGALARTVDRMRAAFPVNLIQVARLGCGGGTSARETNSLPFLPAASVRPGMAMFDSRGNFTVVTRVETVPYNGLVYDIDIEPTHNFIANGVVTHNSVYGWRGADIRNILDFQKDFPSARVVRLEENYRSTPPILDVANVVISLNASRLGKTLRPTRSGGEKVAVVGCLDERDEAEFIADELAARQVAHRDLTLRDVAVLYRTNAQSRALEETMRRRGIPYRLVGAVRFYDRREIRDLMSYLKLVANPADDEAFLRAVAVPRRGLGDATLDALAQRARAEGLPLLAAAARGDLVEGLRPAARQALADFASMIADLRRRATDAAVDELLREVIDRVRYAEYLRAEGPEGAERLENVRELITGAAEAVLEEGGELGLTPVDHFLQRASLIADIDRYDETADAITMMTLHNAKGLEFPLVFITGVEEGLFPLSRAHDEPDQLEEERRLFYVGITRAERKLYITHARSRRRNGETMPSVPSSFLAPIPPAMVETRSTIRLRATGRAVLPQPPSARRAGRPVSAAAADPDLEASQDAPRLVKGERVRHARFGSGTVAELSGVGREMKVTIDFDDEAIGRKRLVVAYAGLERGWD